jgi:hypothetical protein
MRHPEGPRKHAEADGVAPLVYLILSICLYLYVVFMATMFSNRRAGNGPSRGKISRGHARVGKVSVENSSVLKEN